MTTPFHALRHRVQAYLPVWMSNRPRGKNVFAKFAYALIRPFDILLQWAMLGVFAAWPGYGTPTALNLIGQSRDIRRGEAESNDSYAARLRAWLETWKDAGTSEVIARQVQAYLGNTPTVRIVNRAGAWLSLAPDGTVTRTKAADAAWAWDWDSVSNPTRSGWWSDLWILVYPCEWAVTGSTLASLAGKWGTSTGVGTGHEVPRAAVDAILGLVGTWKGTHTWVEAIIWSYDAALFDPAVVDARNPDGTWGEWTKPFGTTRVAARAGAADGTVRYWVPRNGGG